MKEHHYAESDSQLDNEDALVAWTLRASLISSSLSGATQLLLLAHTHQSVVKLLSISIVMIWLVED